MSRHPFRRVARNGLACLLIGPGTALSRWGVRVMWPDDRPEDETDAAITRAAAALESSSETVTRLMRDGTIKPRDLKAFHRIAMNFLDIRAQAVGDEAWMARRRAEEERKRADRRAERGALVTLDTDPDRVALTYNHGRGWQPGDGRCIGPRHDSISGEVCCGGPDRLVCGIGRVEQAREADR